VPTVAKALPVPAFGCVADATEEVTADSTPAVKAETAITAMRLRSVVFDIFFLSLVRIRNFLTSGSKIFRSSNSASPWHTRVMPREAENLFIQWSTACHLLALEPAT
jgi:hypothetical protein